MQVVFLSSFLFRLLNDMVLVFCLGCILHYVCRETLVFKKGKRKNVIFLESVQSVLDAFTKY